MKPLQILQFKVKVNLVVMAMREYSTVPRTQEL